MSEISAASLSEAFPLPTVVIGKAEEVVLANRAARDLIGEHIVGLPYVTALRQPRLLARIEEAATTQAKVTGRYTTEVARKDVIYDVEITPNHDELVLVFIDRTEAHELGAFRRDFVANVSHELRTPLASVLGFIETLRGPAKDDPAAQDRFLGIMESEATRMSRLVDDLLSLSRVEENERKRPDEQVALSPIITATLTEMQPIVDASGAKVTFIDNSDDSLVLADHAQLRQVIGNLVENALRYGADGGTVEIVLSPTVFEARLRADAVRLSVRDEGEGIAQHHIPRLTERFYRVDSHRSREVGGTGLGLAIVKHIIHRHRGRLLIDSEIGKGSTFTVVLPVFTQNSELS